ncbi:hypothetical protein SAMN05216249_10459 [Acetitomaculum ruminis DSM 5522]|uniref:Uncharacterized protein n=1 Tax=Acetitomaculum ruminis DSM 5522 TaxID=1120918 RepID=A0A1I0WFY2_9FIRM|nr:hypothetical protein [Acetitomaculum ruminis]SFA87642.1 hypothetical protein SAMN05216249_10459 [Acetitomaculum ruminis DSM 5522]
MALSKAEIDSLIALVKDQVERFTPIDTNYLDLIILRLIGFGLKITKDDAFTIAFAKQSVKNDILSFCNIKNITEEMSELFVDMVCGEVLYGEYSSGRLNLKELNLDGAISSMSMGDTSVSYDTSKSDEAKVIDLIGALRNKRSKLICYRKINW